MLFNYSLDESLHSVHPSILMTFLTLLECLTFVGSSGYRHWVPLYIIGWIYPDRIFSTVFWVYLLDSTWPSHPMDLWFLSDIGYIMRYKYTLVGIGTSAD